MSPKILIIGGGVIGLATAFELAGRGARVQVFDSRRPGQEASWAGAGLLSLLLPWDYQESLVRLATYSAGLYQSWAARIREIADLDPEYRRTGLLLLPPFDAAAATAWLQRHGHPSSPTPPRVSDAVPGATTGCWLPDVAQVRNPRLLKALLAAAEALGVEVHAGTPVTAIEADAGRIGRLRAGGRWWPADVAVLAAGAWTPGIGGTLTAPLPIRPIRGQMLLYKLPPERLPCMVVQGGHYLVPRADGHLLAGSTLEDVGFDRATTRQAAETLHTFAANLLPELAGRQPLRHWAGLRPGSPENLPIIGRHPRLANLFVNSGHFRYGVTLAPASAELLADIIEDRPSSLDPRCFAWPETKRSPDSRCSLPPEGMVSSFGTAVRN